MACSDKKLDCGCNDCMGWEPSSNKRLLAQEGLSLLVGHGLGNAGHGTGRPQGQGHGSGGWGGGGLIEPVPPRNSGGEIEVRPVRPDRPFADARNNQLDWGWRALFLNWLCWMIRLGRMTLADANAMVIDALAAVAKTEGEFIALLDKHKDDAGMLADCLPPGWDDGFGGGVSANRRHNLRHFWGVLKWGRIGAGGDTIWSDLTETDDPEDRAEREANRRGIRGWRQLKRCLFRARMEALASGPPASFNQETYAWNKCRSLPGAAWRRDYTRARRGR